MLPDSVRAALIDEGGGGAVGLDLASYTWNIHLGVPGTARVGGGIGNGGANHVNQPSQSSTSLISTSVTTTTSTGQGGEVPEVGTRDKEEDRDDDIADNCDDDGVGDDDKNHEYYDDQPGFDGNVGEDGDGG